MIKFNQNPKLQNNLFQELNHRTKKFMGKERLIMQLSSQISGKKMKKTNVPFSQSYSKELSIEIRQRYKLKKIEDKNQIQNRSCTRPKESP